MILSVETYLDTLLAFVPQRKGNRFGGDYIALIHVPAHGPERVYSLTHGSKGTLLTVANYQETVWEAIESSADGVNHDYHPRLEALQAEVNDDHPVLDYLGHSTLSACASECEGRPGMDYYLMLWQKDGVANVVECWEPFAKELEGWTTVIDAMQALSSQFENLVAESQL